MGEVCVEAGVSTTVQVRAAALKPSWQLVLGFPSAFPCSRATSAWTLSESEIEKGQPAFPVEAPPRLSGLGWQHRLRQFSNPLGEPAVPARPQPLASADES